MNWLARITSLGLLVAVGASLVTADWPTTRERARGEQQGLLKPEVFEYKFLDANTVNCTIASDGPYADYRRTNSSGLEWPKGSAKFAVYTAGLWMGGIHRPTGRIRMAQMDYQSEYQAGPLLETFNTTTNDDALPVRRAGDAKYRLYKVSKTRPDGRESDQIDAWADWPGDLGAPYEDVNANGVWDPGVDRPQFTGDQMIWCVVNDANQSKHTNISTTRPMGVEIQTLYFEFAQPGALGNMMFMRWLVINKSDADYDSVFVGMFSDVDLGDANDDLPGSDTTLSLGYVYNGDENDGTASGYGSPPPAVGFDFFQGPIVPGAPTDTARFGDGVRPGFRNLPATSFVVYTNGTFNQIVDPPDRDPNYPRIAYDYLLGKAGTIGQYLFSKIDGSPYRFFMSGDPVAGTGELPSNFPLGDFGPQDVRIMINSGPFTLAKGDTQEIVGAIVLARGGSRLGSITALKRTDALAQQAFDDRFNVPAPPPLPIVRVSELPNALVLDWTEGADSTENYRFTTVKGQDTLYDYGFEGYNLYQGEGPNGPWVRVLTYDKVNGVTLIEDMVQDPVTGNFYLRPVQYGDDTGLKRYFMIDKDYIQGGPLVNGRTYYFALTTYARNLLPPELSEGLVKTLENPTDPISGGIIPKGIAVGTDVPTSPGQVIPTSRGLDDAVVPIIIDPLSAKDATYEVTFNGAGTSVTSWNLYRTGTGGVKDTVLKDVTTFSTSSFEAPYMAGDGLQVSVVNPAAGVRRSTQPVPRGWEYAPSYNSGWVGSSGEGTWQYGGYVSYPIKGTDLGSGIGSPGSKVPVDQVKKAEIRFGQSQRAYRYLAKVNSGPIPTPRPPQDPSFVPYILRRGPGYVYQGDYETVTVPFTVWEVDSLDGDLTPRQLNVGFLENNDPLYDSTGREIGLGKIDGQWSPTGGVNGGLEVLYIFGSTYSETVDSLYVRNPINKTQPINLQIHTDSLDVYYIAHIVRADPALDWKAGDKVLISPNYPLTTSRVYTFSTEASKEVSPQEAKNQVASINVFPNPYFAHNPYELNQYNRFVTFTNLPPKALIRIFTLTGEVIRTIDHNNTTGLEQWDLRNTNGLPVASGIYIVHIEIPEVGNRILKLAVIQPEERPTRI